MTAGEIVARFSTASCRSRRSPSTSDRAGEQRAGVAREARPVHYGLRADAARRYAGAVPRSGLPALAPVPPRQRGGGEAQEGDVRRRRQGRAVDGMSAFAHGQAEAHSSRHNSKWLRDPTRMTAEIDAHTLKSWVSDCCRDRADRCARGRAVHEAPTSPHERCSTAGLAGPVGAGAEPGRAHGPDRCRRRSRQRAAIRARGYGLQPAHPQAAALAWGEAGYTLYAGVNVPSTFRRAGRASLATRRASTLRQQLGRRCAMH